MYQEMKLLFIALCNTVNVYICVTQLHQKYYLMYVYITHVIVVGYSCDLCQNFCTFSIPIQVQKEQYLAYRKVFHNDDTDVFEKRRREVLEKAKLPRMSQPVGPSPFAGLSNYAAMMLTQAMQAPQQAQQQPPTGN